MSERKPSFAETISEAIRARLLDVRTIVPANVVAYNPATMAAAVAPAPKTRLRSGESLPIAPVADAPVAFPAGGGFTISWALLPGDPVLLLCSDRAIDRWRVTGSPYVPSDSETHAIRDCFVWPGSGPAPDPATGASATDLLIHTPVGAVIRVRPNGTIGLAETLPLGVGDPAVARVGDLTVAGATMTAWIASVTAAVTTMAAAFNAAPPGTPMTTLGAGSVVPPIAPSDFGIINTGSAKATCG